MEASTFFVAVPVLLLGFVPSEVPAPVWALLAASAVTHSVYAYSLSRSYAHGDLSLVYPIVRSTPAFVPLIAVPLLGEVVSPIGGAGIVLVVASLWLVQRGGDAVRLEARAFVSRGALLAVLTLLVTVVYSIVDKQAMARLGEAPWTGAAPRALVYLALLYVSYLPLFAMLARRSVGVRDVAAAFRERPWLPIAAAACDIGSYGLILHALQTAPVSYVVAARQASVLFVIGFALVLLRERPGRVRMLGAALNVAGVALIAIGD
jgi:drug/metabolite transporter (DMT)-like permease